MRKIIVAIFLVITFLCSCSNLNSAANLNTTTKLKPDDAIACSNRGIAYAKLGNIRVPLKNITRPYACNRI